LVRLTTRLTKSSLITRASRAFRKTMLGKDLRVVKAVAGRHSTCSHRTD